MGGERVGQDPCAELGIAARGIRREFERRERGDEDRRARAEAELFPSRLVAQGARVEPGCGGRCAPRERLAHLGGHQGRFARRVGDRVPIDGSDERRGPLEDGVGAGEHDLAGGACDHVPFRTSSTEAPGPGRATTTFSTPGKSRNTEAIRGASAALERTLTWGPASIVT